MQAVCSARPAAPVAARGPSSSSAFMAGRSIPRAPMRAASRPSPRQLTTKGLFGLGVPEVAVIAGVAALIFGAEVGWRRDRPRQGVARRGRRRRCRRRTRCRRAIAAELCAGWVNPSLPVHAVLAGPSKLPELGKGLGKTVKNFQSAAKVRGCVAQRCTTLQPCMLAPECTRLWHGGGCAMLVRSMCEQRRVGSCASYHSCDCSTAEAGATPSGRLHRAAALRPSYSPTSSTLQAPLKKEPRGADPSSAASSPSSLTGGLFD